MTSRLGLYNAALRCIGQRQLASLSEDVEPRYVLDNVWDDGFVDRVLKRGLWNFATRTVELTYDPGIEPSFGYRRVFAKPGDWLRTSALCSDGHFKQPLNAYHDEAQFWACDLDTIYVRYISNDEQYGGDLGNWPEDFTDFAAAFMASQMAPGPTRSQEMVERIKRDAKQLLHEARATDASNEGAKFPPYGNWVNSRRAQGFTRRNRENG